MLRYENTGSPHMVRLAKRRFEPIILLSQGKLARMADVANNTIVKIETEKNQNPTLDTFKKIAKALEVSVENLIK